MLDVAAGRGRHTRYLCERGHPVVAVDRDVSGLADLRGQRGIELHEADLENHPWPFPGRTFDGVVVANYLHRPLLAVLAESVADRGVLIYETFARGHERLGRPRNPDFLLREGELLEAFGRAPFAVVGYQQVREDSPTPAVRQRICVRRSR